MFSGQCVSSDKKFITIETLRRLITRDCPIKNEGPCPKNRVTALPMVQEPCECPLITSASPCRVFFSTLSPTSECDCLDLMNRLSATTVATTSTSTRFPAARAQKLVLTTSKCDEDLKLCEQSLIFAGTSKSGAQESRRTWEEETIRLQGEMMLLNVTKTQFQNRSIDLSVEIRKCHQEKQEFENGLTFLKEGWRKTNLTLLQLQVDDVNMTQLWEKCLEDRVHGETLADDRKTNLTVCEGSLTSVRQKDRACQALLPGLRKNGSGIDFSVAKVYF